MLKRLLLTLLRIILSRLESGARPTIRITATNQSGAANMADFQVHVGKKVTLTASTFQGTASAPHTAPNWTISGSADTDGLTAFATDRLSDAVDIVGVQAGVSTLIFNCTVSPVAGDPELSKTVTVEVVLLADNVVVTASPEHD